MSEATWLCTAENAARAITAIETTARIAAEGMMSRSIALQLTPVAGIADDFSRITGLQRSTRIDKKLEQLQNPARCGNSGLFFRLGSHQNITEVRERFGVLPTVVLTNTTIRD
jgi:hypothetical protein